MWKPKWTRTIPLFHEIVYAWETEGLSEWRYLIPDRDDDDDNALFTTYLLTTGRFVLESAKQQQQSKKYSKPSNLYTWNMSSQSTPRKIMINASCNDDGLLVGS